MLGPRSHSTLSFLWAKASRHAGTGRHYPRLHGRAACLRSRPPKWAAGVQQSRPHCSRGAAPSMCARTSWACLVTSLKVECSGSTPAGWRRMAEEGRTGVRTRNPLCKLGEPHAVSGTRPRSMFEHALTILSRPVAHEGVNSKAPEERARLGRPLCNARLNGGVHVLIERVAQLRDG